MPERQVTVDEITKHSSPDDCWIVVDGKVYDITEYAPDHPGGAAIIHKHAGRDASSTYNSIHAPSLIAKTLASSKHIGTLDKSSITDDWAKPPPQATPELKLDEKPPLFTLINAADFERVASRTLTQKTWAFYSSAATECVTRDQNRLMFDRIWLRPRLLVDVKPVSTQTKILGCAASSPLMISPAALARMAHPDGEKAMARAAAKAGIIQCISTNSSYPVSEILPETPETHPTFYQLYVHNDRAKAEALIKHVLSLRPRIKAILITIDAPVPGKREADERVKADETLSSPNSGARASNDKRGGGIGRLMGSFITPSLTWEDLAWIRELVGPDFPLLLKGVQSAADAQLACEAGLQGIMVSNHGGRNLDTAPPAVLTLLEMHRCCPQVFGRMEILVDGGVRRGTDILKCLCLGATGVGVGRSFLYAVNYGQEGVEHLIEILQEELQTAMALVGITDVSQAHPGLINTADLDHLVPTGLVEHPWIKYRSRARL